MRREKRDVKSKSRFDTLRKRNIPSPSVLTYPPSLKKWLS